MQGIKTNKFRYLTFLMSVMFTDFAGIMYAGRMRAGNYTLGDGDELSGYRGGYSRVGRAWPAATEWLWVRSLNRC